MMKCVECKLTFDINTKCINIFNEVDALFLSLSLSLYIYIYIYSGVYLFILQIVCVVKQ